MLLVMMMIVLMAFESWVHTYWGIHAEEIVNIFALAIRLGLIALQHHLSDNSYHINYNILAYRYLGLFLIDDV
jgi:hypothetical protein